MVKKNESVVLSVPSVVIPSGVQFNPNHPDFSKIRFSAPEPFAFDPRLK